jgi:hypothetical protein
MPCTNALTHRLQNALLMKMAIATTFVFALGIAPGIGAYSGTPPQAPEVPKQAKAHKPAHGDAAATPVPPVSRHKA